MFNKDTGSYSYFPESDNPRLGLVWELTMTELYSGTALVNAWEWIETKDAGRGVGHGIPSIFD